LAAGRADRSFPGACRLASSNDFRLAYRSKRRGRVGPLGWHARNNNLGFARLGMAVPKRAVKLATDRSRIKRLIRESFRHHRGALPAVDVVVSVKASPRDPYDPVLRRQIDDIWRAVLSSASDAP
jgi:ribonuclease P protein component